MGLRKAEQSLFFADFKVPLERRDSTQYSDCTTPRTVYQAVSQLLGLQLHKHAR